MGVIKSTTTEPVWDERRLANVHTQGDKAERVRRMFDTIAPTYELVNTVFSGGRDRAWRKRMVQLARVQSGDAILDVACGTGDVLRAFTRYAPQAGRFVGIDFAHAMLCRASSRDTDRVCWCEADALHLPFASETFDVASSAFGVRNFQALDRGLLEMTRVLRPGGRVVILEFTCPPNRLIRALHKVYSEWIMPYAASLIARDRSGAYRYLPRSVLSFLNAEQLCERMRSAGLAHVSAHPRTFGVVTVYVGTKGNG